MGHAQVNKDCFAEDLYAGESLLRKWKRTERNDACPFKNYFEHLFLIALAAVSIYWLTGDGTTKQEFRRSLYNKQRASACLAQRKMAVSRD